jgi:hypothetical protein
VPMVFAREKINSACTCRFNSESQSEVAADSVFPPGARSSARVPLTWSQRKSAAQQGFFAGSEIQTESQKRLTRSKPVRSDPATIIHAVPLGLLCC